MTLKEISFRIYIYVAASHDNANAGIYTKCSLRVWGLEKSLHRVNMKSVVHFSNFWTSRDTISSFLSLDNCTMLINVDFTLRLRLFVYLDLERVLSARHDKFTKMKFFRNFALINLQPVYTECDFNFIVKLRIKRTSNLLQLDRINFSYQRVKA